jgi:hypothetical protein
MKTSRRTCVSILFMLFTGTRITSAASPPGNTTHLGQTPSVPEPSPQSQANPTAPSEPAQAASGHRVTGEWQGMVATQHVAE